MEKQIIFYGAGQYAERNINRWISDGLVPLCFADADVDKHYGKIETAAGEREIFPLDEAITLYPDYSLYVTLDPRHLHKVTMYLRDKDIPQERIRYADGHQWGLNCPSLDMIFIYGNRISFCCGNHIAKIYDWFRIPMKDYKTGITELYEFRRSLRELHRLGIKGPCEECDFAQEGIVPANLLPKPKSITFNTGFGDDICNMDCVYCVAKPRLANKYGGELFGTLRQVVEYYDVGALPDIHLNCGEFFARKDADGILDYLADKDCRISTATSASIYSESFARLIGMGKTDSILVSLDCGTAETYKKVKGRNCFDRVVRNLADYSGLGAKIDLKYIVLPEINNNKTDVSSFMEIAKRIKARRIDIAADTTQTKDRLPEQSLDAVMDIYMMAKEACFDVCVHLYHFNPKDVVLLKRRMNNE